MKSLFLTVVFVIVTLTAGCATGPKYTETSQTLPTLENGAGRIFFYRPGKVLGAAIQPKVHLNDEVIGTAKPGGFFYVDRAPGPYHVSMKTEAEKSLEFDLAAGESKYVRLTTGFGAVVYRVKPELRPEPEALVEMESLRYAGE